MLALSIAAPVFGLAVPPAPPLERPIVDHTGTLNDQQITNLAEHIKTGRETKSYQLGVLMIPRLDGDSLEEYSLSVARGWGIGDKKTSNGVLLLVIKDERKLRIEVGYGAEGGLNDARAGRIIRNTITPAFREGDYYKGIYDGITEIQAAMDNRPEGTNTAQNTPSGGVDLGAMIGNGFIFAMIVFPWIGAVLGRTKSWWAGGVIGGVVGLIICVVMGFALLAVIAAGGLILIGLLLDFLVSKNYKEHRRLGDSPSWWAGGSSWGGNSGGGGGSSFGGGSFGGGGSSGSW